MGRLVEGVEAPQTVNQDRFNPDPITPTQQPLLFVPGPILACGLRDAHTRPLVGKRTSLGGIRSWRTSPARAWAWPLVEFSRTGNSYATLSFDCDSRESVERAAAACMGVGLPTPNAFVVRKASGHAQVHWMLACPVIRGEHARAKPLAYLARVSEWYRATLGADSGYRGVLSSNPVHSDYTVSYPRPEPYELSQLATAIPARWRVPKVPTTDIGRNCDLFRGLCRLALGCSDDGLLVWARTLNREFAVPLADAEVRGVWGSVCRYRKRWRVEGHKSGWLWKQAEVGRRGGRASGVVRRAGTPLEANRAPWESAGVSRATWYRRGENGGRKRGGAGCETEANTGSQPLGLFVES